MEQRQPPPQIFIDDGVGGAGHRFFIPQSPGKAPGKGGLARPQIPPECKHHAGPELLGQLFRHRLGLPGRMCFKNHIASFPGRPKGKAQFICHSSCHGKRRICLPPCHPERSVSEVEGSHRRKVEILRLTSLPQNDIRKRAASQKCGVTGCFSAFPPGRRWQGHR